MQLPVGCRVTAQAHYDWIIQDTDRYIATLGVTYKYLHEDSPFRKDAPRSPVIETYQRNQALNYSYRVTVPCTDPALARLYDSSCTVVGEKAEAGRPPCAGTHHRLHAVAAAASATNNSPPSRQIVVLPPSISQGDPERFTLYQAHRTTPFP